MLLFALFGLAAGCAKEEVRGVVDDSVVGTVQTRSSEEDCECDCRIEILESGGNGWLIWPLTGSSVQDEDLINSGDQLCLFSPAQFPEPEPWATIQIICTEGEEPILSYCSSTTMDLNWNEGSGNTNIRCFDIDFICREVRGELGPQ